MEPQSLKTFELLRCFDMTLEEIKIFTKDPKWIAFRKTIKGSPLDVKYDRLYDWLRDHQHDRASSVQVGNYVNAVSRGGFLKKDLPI